MKRILPSLAVLLLLVTPVAAQDYYKGLDAYERGDYTTALREWQPLAEQGYAVVQTNLGIMYSNVFGGPLDYAEAVKWYRRAAEQGHPGGQKNLGFMYVQGHGVPQDYVQAHMWFNLAAARDREFASAGRDIVARKMTPDQIAEAQRMAREWQAEHQK